MIRGNIFFFITREQYGGQEESLIGMTTLFIHLSYLYIIKLKRYKFHILYIFILFFIFVKEKYYFTLLFKQ